MENIKKEPSLKVLHVLDHSLPYITSYSLRSRYLIKLQREIGITPLAITSPKHTIVSHPLELMEGVFHYRTFPPEDGSSSWRLCPFREEKSLISVLSQAISLLVTNQKIDLIHAHSPFTNGLAALEVCRKHKIPLLYELRDLQTDTGGLRKAGAFSSTLSQNLEIFLCQQVGAVVVIGEKRQEQIIKGGIPNDNIYMFPREEGVHMLKPAVEQDEDFIKKHNLQNDPVAGFMGSFYHQEGIDPLFLAFLKVREKMPAPEFLFSKSEDEQVKTTRQDASGHIIYVGQGNHRNIQRSYSLIDILVYPQMDIDDKFLPPNSLEALVMDGDSVSGDMKDLQKLMVDKQTGLFLGDISDLTGRYLKLLMNKQIKQNRSSRRQAWGTRPGWPKILEQYLMVYKKLLAS